MPITLEQLRAHAPTLTHLMVQAGEEDTLRFSAVTYGPEFYRVASLDRRAILTQDDPEAVELAELLTNKLARVKSPYPGRLRAIQGLALKEGWENKGGVGMLRVGAGKTGVAFLLPEIWDPHRTARVLIVTKASMIKDMEGERRLMGRDWNIRPPYQCPIISYELLSSPSSGEVLDNDGNVIVRSRLERLAPTHIIFDEAHCLADSGSTGAKRVQAYLDEHPNTCVWVMTGTMFKQSIKDASHLFRWALKERAPLPYDFKERETWASALDARAPGMGGVRAGFGALLDFLSADDRLEFDTAGENNFTEQVRIVRQAVARRILETPGVIGTQDPPLDIGLEIDHVLPADEDDDIEELFKILRGVPQPPKPRAEWDHPGWRLPDGTEIPDAIQMARYINTGGYGFWNIWNPDPPKTWRFHRNMWAKWCRHAIRYLARGKFRSIDSEARVADAVQRGMFNDEWDIYDVQAAAMAGKIPKGINPQSLIGQSRLQNWLEAQAAERERTGLLEPPSVAVWVSEQIVEECEAWLKKVGNGVIWVDSIGLGELLSSRLSIPYYGAGSVDKTGRHIKKHPGGPAIASIKSNGTGKNLQGFWANNLWLTPPNEQALGRTHRSGQQADTVRNWVFIGCQEHLRSFHAARATKAAFAEQMQLSPQKLRYAKTNMPTAGGLLASRTGRRWALSGGLQDEED
jgi:hypothetical protein